MFETMTAAKDELRKLKIIHESNGQAGLNLTDNLRLAAVECTKLLRPYGKTIYDATKHYLEYLEADKSELTTELIKSYLQTRKRAGLSERHLADIEGKLQCFGEPFGTRPVKTLTSREIEAWLYSLGNGELAPQSLINWRAVLHAFFEQLFQEKILSANPIGAIRKPKHIREAPPIFTPEELSKLLGAASGHLVAPLAIQAFAGLRTSETLRLHWQNVQDSYIHVNAEIAKTSRRRLDQDSPEPGELAGSFSKVTRERLAERSQELSRRDPGAGPQRRRRMETQRPAPFLCVLSAGRICQR